MSVSKIEITLGGSKEEGILSWIRTPDGKGESGSKPWPFNDRGETLFDSWFSDYKLQDSTPKEIGLILYQELFNHKIHRYLQDSIKDFDNTSELIINITTHSKELHRIPFEIIYDGEKFLFASNRTIIRYVNEGTPIELRSKEFENVLFILSEPEDPELDQWGQKDFIKGIENILSERGIDPKFLPNCSIEDLEDHLLHSEVQYDAVFIIAHGEQPKSNEDGFIWLEENKQKKEFYSSQLSAYLREQLGCFVFLCSCSSGEVVSNNPLASIAMNLIFDGPVGSVIAMQRPITVKMGLKVVKSFLFSLKKNNDIFVAYKDACINLLSGKELGVPVLYTRPQKEMPKSPLTESEKNIDRKRIESFFSIHDEAQKFAFIFPVFKMGLKNISYDDAVEKNWISLPEGEYKYKGPTTSVTALEASKGLVALLGKVFDWSNLHKHIHFFSDSDAEQVFQDSSYTHIILFGHKSHGFSREVLKKYSEDFKFPDDSPEGKWAIEDLRTNELYEVPDPQISDSEIEKSGYKGPDYALIEKITDTEDKRVLFVIAGIRAKSTQAAGEYLITKFDLIQRKFGSGGFQILLAIKPGTTEVIEEIVSRSPKLKEESE